MAEYNGWANYETWVVKLWMDNEQPTYDYWRDIASGYILLGDADSKRTGPLAERLKDDYQANLPIVEGVWSDLLQSALSEVDWYEIADSILDDIDQSGAA